MIITLIMIIMIIIIIIIIIIIMIIIINSLFQPGNFPAGSTTAKDFSPFRELQGLEMYYIMNDHCIK